jgi:hypothetical protein
MAVASKMCLTQIDISIPKATILLPSKQFFETIYNRLSTDLCLWEPSAPEYFASHGHETQNMSSFSGLSSAVLQSPIPNMFIMCKSGVAYGNSILNFYTTVSIRYLLTFILSQNRIRSLMKVKVGLFPT